MAVLESLETQFMTFIEDYEDEDGEVKYDKEISRMVTEGKHSLEIDFNDLYLFNIELADTLLSPKTDYSVLTTVIRSKARTKNPVFMESLPRLNIRIHNLPYNINLRQVASEHIGRLIQISAIVTRATGVIPLVTKAAFRCPVCGEYTHLEQVSNKLEKPPKCTACDNRKGLYIDPEESQYVNFQRLNVQERPEELPAGQLPRSLVITVHDDLVDLARPGDRITLVGRVKLLPKYGRGGELAEFEIYLEANHIEIEGKTHDLIELTPEDEKQILEIAKDPLVHQKLINSIAPSIYGNEYIKESILYTLTSGTRKELDDITIRGDVNILMVGDPGTAKSQLLNFAAKVAPRGIMTTGRGSTAAGLTAAVVKEPGSEGFILEAGALVLADKGICCIDEIDKMRDEDRGAIHPAMEQQIVPIAKGGIVATLNSRAAIIAAANPILGRYNPYSTVAQNINLPVTLLSRFDIIWVLRDTPDKEKDRELAKHIITLHRDKPHNQLIPAELFRKYISYAKRIEPKIGPEASQRFEDFYVQMRTASVKGGEAAAIAITARQLESVIRLAEARAKSRLSETITIEDAEAAINLIQKSLEQVGIDANTGQIDIDILYSGKPRSLQGQLQKVLQEIGEMELISGSVKENDLFESLSSDHGLNRSEAVRLLGVLMKDGTIYMPRPGYYRRTD